MSGLGQMVDTTKVRTAEDVERKFSLEKITRNFEVVDNQIVNIQADLDNFTDVVLPDMQEQIDGKVETWYYEGEPSLLNLPASAWTTDDEKDKHIGDLYYDQSTGYSYIFQKESGLYVWDDKPDSSTREALSIANDAYDTADSKRTTYTEQPTPPYSNGDLWVQGANGDILVCQVSRTEGSFDSEDWIPASKYTDNTMAEAIVDEMGGTETTILSGQVIREMANYTKFTDLATGGSSIISGDNITTGNIKSANFVQDVSGTKIDLTNGKITTPYVDLDDGGFKAKGKDGEYIKINTQVGFSGYDKNDDRTYWGDSTGFHAKKMEAEEEIDLVKKCAILPITRYDAQDNVINDGIAFIGII